MAKMLRPSATKCYGCCDACASGKMLHLKPGPRERHQARAREKRDWRKAGRAYLSAGTGAPSRL